MPIVATIEVGKITTLWGTAILRLPNGTTRQLKVGDVVHKGDVILTAQNSIVEIKNESGEPVTTAALPPQPGLDDIIGRIEAGDPNVVPAAGAASAAPSASAAPASSAAPAAK